MPQQQILPTWTALNNANFTNPSGMSDPVSSQPYNAGGLNLGDYFDVTNDEAQGASYLTNGLLFEGRYRLVQVDSGATASNVKTGTIGYVRAGSTVKGVAITNAGTGQTTGSYVVQATAGSGGGSGASINVAVSGAGLITAVSVNTPGYGYVSVPSFNLAAVIGGSGGAVAPQLGLSPNVVTSYDVATGGNAAQAGVGPVRPVVFLNSITPGNYGFVQELGTASVLGNASIGSGAAISNYVEATTGGTVNAPSATTSPTTSTIGQAVDLPIASNLFKVILNGPVVQD